MSLDYKKTVYRKGPPTKLCRTSYGSMNQWQDFMSNEWDTYNFINRQAALSPVRRRPPPPSPHHGFRSDDPAHLQYYKSGGYDDYHKTYLKLQQQHGLSPRFPEYGPPKLRNGNAGGSWRHVKQVLQAGGSRILFVDGQPRITDNGMVRFEEVPGANVLQPVAEKNSKTRHLGKSPSQTPWTGHKLNAFKASEGQNYMIMR